MPTKEQMDRAADAIRKLEGGVFVRESGVVMEVTSASANRAVFWTDLSQGERMGLLGSTVNFEGFEADQAEDVMSRVADREDPVDWMDGVGMQPSSEELERRRDVDGSGLTAAERDRYYFEPEGGESQEYTFRMKCEVQAFEMNFWAADLENAAARVREECDPEKDATLTGGGAQYRFDGAEWQRQAPSGPEVFGFDSAPTPDQLAQIDDAIRADLGLVDHGMEMPTAAEMRAITRELHGNETHRPLFEKGVRYEDVKESPRPTGHTHER